EPGVYVDIGERVYQRVTLKSFVDSVKAVKRDFLGIPIIVAWQPIRNHGFYERRFDMTNVYDRCYEDSKRRLDGYVNNSWTFYPMAKVVKTRIEDGTAEYLANPNSISIHLDDTGHRLVAEILHDEMLPVMMQYLPSRLR